jgi:hypothetical protein
MVGGCRREIGASISQLELIKDKVGCGAIHREKSNFRRNRQI